MKNDLTLLFSNDSEISSILDDEDYNGEYSNIVVKDKYEVLPEISYPMITIEELMNEEVNRYTDDSGENISYAAYQFEISAKQDKRFTAKENVVRIREIIDYLMKTDTYRCLRRISTPQIVPKKSDSNVMLGFLRYDCHIDIKKNIIYRRY